MAIGTLIRLPNLLILVVAVYLYSFGILYPALISGQIVPLMGKKDFWLFLFIIICTSAGGYVLNDILDRNTDAINDKRQVIGSAITSKLAWLYYLFLALAPIPLVYSLGVEFDSQIYMPGYLAVVAILFLYNTILKRLPLLGNIVVAALCAFVILLPYLIEYQGLQQLQLSNQSSLLRATHITWVFTLFTFTTHLIREIIKDVEDLKGDAAAGFYTIPVVLGIQHTKTLILILEVILLFTILYWIVSSEYIAPYRFWHGLILIPVLLLIIYKSILASDPAFYTLLGHLLKVLMLAGLVSLYLLSL